MRRTELERIKRVSDLMCSCHSILRDQYGTWAFWLDIAILAVSVWLTAMAFVEPTIGVSLSPFGLSKDLWLGLLSIGVLFLAILQLRVNWKERSDAHERARTYYGSIKKDCGQVLATAGEVGPDEHEFVRVMDRYATAGEMSIAIPDSKFGSLKQQHKLKIEISRYLDDHPAASLWIVKLKLWARDNFLKR